MTRTHSSATLLPPIVIGGTEYPDLGYCRTPWGGGLHADGPVIHTTYCRRGSGWGDTATSGSDCIQPGQDGAAIQARREAAADKRRFTPPEYRDGHIARPGQPIEILDRHQPVEVLALRGRPRGADGSGVGEWTTWETYTERDDGTFLGSLRRITERPQPVEMTPADAASLVAEFSARVPGYEFTVVRAHLTIVEETLA